MSGRVGVPTPDKLGLRCKANQCSNAWIGGLELLTTHETSLMEIATLQLVMPTQPAPITSECSICLAKRNPSARPDENLPYLLA